MIRRDDYSFCDCPNNMDLTNSNTICSCLSNTKLNPETNNSCICSNSIMVFITGNNKTCFCPNNMEDKENNNICSCPNNTQLLNDEVSCGCRGSFTNYDRNTKSCVCLVGFT